MLGEPICCLRPGINIDSAIGFECVVHWLPLFIIWNELVNDRAGQEPVKILRILDGNDLVVLVVEDDGGRKPCNPTPY